MEGSMRAAWWKKIFLSARTRFSDAPSTASYPKNVQIESDVNIAQGVTIQGTYPVLIGMGSILNTGLVLDASNGSITIGTSCVLGRHTQIKSSAAGIVIGAETVVGVDSDLNAGSGSLIIGGKCNIGAHVSLRGDGRGINLASECKIGANSVLDALGGEIFLGEKTVIGNNCMVIGTGRGVHIQSNCDFHHGVILDAQGGFIEINSFSGAGPYAIIYGHGGMTIGKYCAIAGQTVLIPANHRFDRLDIPIRQQGLSTIGISIGDDVWIGTHCVILDGAKIGRGCVIGAGSIVKGCVDEYSVVVGNPGRVIKMRNTQ
jgi:acetyltransferase-like isoleucine patch superfamily enzyme